MTINDKIIIFSNSILIYFANKNIFPRFIMSKSFDLLDETLGATCARQIKKVFLLTLNKSATWTTRLVMWLSPNIVWDGSYDSEFIKFYNIIFLM
jgi:hypothetical protein